MFIIERCQQLCVVCVDPQPHLLAGHSVNEVAQNVFGVSQPFKVVRVLQAVDIILGFTTRLWLDPDICAVTYGGHTFRLRANCLAHSRVYSETKKQICYHTPRSSRHFNISSTCEVPSLLFMEWLSQNVNDDPRLDETFFILMEAKLVRGTVGHGMTKYMYWIIVFFCLIFVLK